MTGRHQTCESSEECSFWAARSMSLIDRLNFAPRSPRFHFLSQGNRNSLNNMKNRTENRPVFLFLVTKISSLVALRSLLANC